MLKLNNMRAQPGANQKPKRVGRGKGSGLGERAGKGDKGQKARKGKSFRPGFEGGQNPLYRRLPKRGFKNAGIPQMTLNLEDLDGMGLSEISLEVLKEVRVAKGKEIQKLVVLGKGEVKGKFTVKAHRVSEAAKEKIEKAGGTVEIVPGRKKYVRPPRVSKKKAAAAAPSA